jgi:hypothetical protein
LVLGCRPEVAVGTMWSLKPGLFMGLVLVWGDLLMALVEMELYLSKCPPRWFCGRPGSVPGN